LAAPALRQAATILWASSRVRHGLVRIWSSGEWRWGLADPLERLNKRMNQSRISR
jgi:hypothetical protein